MSDDIKKIPEIGPKLYYFAKDKYKYYADETEPKLYPDLYESFVRLTDYESLKAENEKLKKIAFEHCDWDSVTGADLELLRAIDKEFRPENYNDKKEI